MIFLLEKKLITWLWESSNDNQLFSNLWKSTLWEPVQTFLIYWYPALVHNCFSKNKKWEPEPCASYFVKTESKKYQKILIPFNTCWYQCWVVLTFLWKKPLILVFEKEVLITGLIVLIIVVQALENC
jgi:hypothetical protein